MEYEKIRGTTTDIINKLDENGNIITTKIKKVYKYGILQEKYYLNSENKLHRDGDKPAQIEYFNKNKYICTWNQNGKTYRDGDEPAYIRYSTSGNVYIKQWYKDNKLHRDGDEPAWIEYNKEIITSKTWYKNGKKHRDNDLPANIEYNIEGSVITSESWYQNGKLHRLIENGPAYVQYKENRIMKEFYYLNHKLIKENNNIIIDKISKFDEEKLIKCLEILEIMEK